MASCQCWITFLTQRTNSLASYLNADTLPDPADWGDINFCIFMNFRLEQMKLEVFANGDCAQLTGMFSCYQFVNITV